MLVSTWPKCHTDEQMEQRFDRIINKLNKHTDIIESVCRSTDAMRSSLVSNEATAPPRKFTKENEFDYDSSFKKEDNRFFSAGQRTSVTSEQRKLFRDALSQFSLTESAIAARVVPLLWPLLA